MNLNHAIPRIIAPLLVVVLLLAVAPRRTLSFSVVAVARKRRSHHHLSSQRLLQTNDRRAVSLPLPQLLPLPSSIAALKSGADDDDDDEGWAVDDHDAVLEEMSRDQELKPSSPAAAASSLDGLERAWRHAKKPLLSVGSKGARMSQGNSLRQLLESHTVVKVKVDTRRLGGSLEAAFERLRTLAEESGAQRGIELIQARDGDKTILFGMPGTLERIERGEFPPPAP